MVGVDRQGGPGGPVVALAHPHEHAAVGVDRAQSAVMPTRPKSLVSRARVAIAGRSGRATAVRGRRARRDGRGRARRAGRRPRHARACRPTTPWPRWTTRPPAGRCRTARGPARCHRPAGRSARRDAGRQVDDGERQSGDDDRRREGNGQQPGPRATDDHECTPRGKTGRLASDAEPDSTVPQNPRQLHFPRPSDVTFVTSLAARAGIGRRNPTLPRCVGREQRTAALTMGIHLLTTVGPRLDNRPTPRPRADLTRWDPVTDEQQRIRHRPPRRPRAGHDPVGDGAPHDGRRGRRERRHGPAAGQHHGRRRQRERRSGQRRRAARTSSTRRPAPTSRSRSS